MPGSHFNTAPPLFSSATPSRLFLRTAAVFGLALLAVSGSFAQIFKDPKAPLEDRVSDLFDRLKPEEKITLLTGTGFTTHPIPRLDVPAMAMADAGQGVRGGADSTHGPATAFPSGVAMAATWDAALIKRVGAAIGEEAHNKGTGVQVLLGPAVNIHRSPLGGRNGEYFSEDPYLAARLGVAYIRGMQGAGTLACIKHFACNNEEVDRRSVDVRVGERALREIYLPAFEAGVKEGKVWSVMSSYNKINGPHASANAYLLTDVLKNGWGFDGVVMSDWGGVHETAVAQAGNDLEMPGGHDVTIPKVQAALADKTMTQNAIDDSVRRILRAVIRSGLLDGPMTPDPKLVNSPDHKALVFETAARGIVLLKNEGGLLPLDRKAIKSIAVIGEPAKKMQIGARGSPDVKPLKTAELLDSLRNAAGDGITLRYATGDSTGDPLPASAVKPPGEKVTHGFKAEYFKNTTLDGKPALTREEEQIQLDTQRPPAPGISATGYSIRWTAMLTAPATGAYRFIFAVDDGFRLFLDGKQLMEHWQPGAARTFTADASLEKGKTYELRVEFFQTTGDSVAKLNWKTPLKSPYADAVESAKKSDAAIVAVSTFPTDGEGHDRPSMNLPNDQAALIHAVAAANKKTIVILNNGAPVEMKSWIDQVSAVIEAWFPGQEGGAAIAAILFGEVNPSGKLPDTFAGKREDYPDYGNFPGKDGRVDYAEGIYVGYRHFDKKGIEPVFPFGYGLSYTTFEYKNIKLSQSHGTVGTSVLASVDVTNTGRREGSEVVQLYIHDPKPQIDKPVRELKGFEKVSLKPGETKTVAFTLTPRDFAYFDVPGRQWRADAGAYDIEVGASSRDIRLKSPLTLDSAYTEKVPLSKDHSQG
ncbi:MAG: glycoside hydrolase family 3 C-terminal domain-containing protein [Terrimicrobiaceae bacterium]|nr:glycoside hydrolase family 3 C-terminal domain-containing protein [Terrimicrobiaceae bacterium]